MDVMDLFALSRQYLKENFIQRARVEKYIGG